MNVCGYRCNQKTIMGGGGGGLLKQYIKKQMYKKWQAGTNVNMSGNFSLKQTTWIKSKMFVHIYA